MTSRLEIDFKRLLYRSEQMANDQKEIDWRLEKYIQSLEGKFNEMKTSSCRPSQETMNEYSKRLEFLKGIVSTEKVTSVSDKSLLTLKLDTVSSSSTTSGLTRELQMNTKSKYHREAREELLGKSDSETRSSNKASSTDDDINTIIQHHHDMQERLANETLALARSLKENISLSKNILRDDKKLISDATKVSDANYSNLKKESENLEKHTQTCSWWIWVMLGLVVITFLFMVLFMRMFKKKVVQQYVHEEL